MPRRIRADRTLFAVVVILTVAGVVMVGSASSYYSLNRTGMTVSYAFLLRQILFASTGLVILYRLMKVDYHVFARRRVVLGLLLVTIALLIAVFVFPARNGTHRWIPLGPISFQPSELSKLALAVFLAWMIDRKGESINLPRVGTIPCFCVAGLLAALVLLGPDLGTSILLLLVTTIVLFAAGLPWHYVAALGATTAIALPVLIFSSPYRAKRLLAFLHPEQDLQGPNFQLLQSKVALGSGGVFGSGLAMGQQKWLYLPESHTDFIFAVIGEELGLAGTVAILALFLALLWRGLRVVVRAPDRFGAYLALGITLFLVCQAFVNLGVATGLLPTKGLPLPFVSYGGSSLLISLGMTGILLNISQQGG